jgi:hypothetical protein
MSPEQADKAFPGAGDFASASLKMFTSPRKMFAIAQKFMYVNMNENGLLRYPSKNESMKKDFASKGIGMAPEQWTDMSLRVLSMASMMVKNGAWDAYSLNKEGLQWDRLKDKRYFNTDGSQTPQQKSLFNALTDRMKNSGEMPRDAKYPDRGDDDFMINNQYKWYANQFAYPGIDDATKALATNNWIGGILFMFKSFLLPRLYNAGVGAKTHDFDAGGAFKTYQGENGEWVTELEQRTMEGQYQSWKRAINDLMSAKGYSPADFAKWWKEQAPQTRQNLIVSIMYAGAMAGLVHWLVPGMSKRDEKRFSYYYSEMMLGYSAVDWMKNPVPMINTTLKVTQVALGQKNFNTITQSVGPVSGVKRIVTTVGK